MVLGKFVVTAPVVIVATAVTAKYAAIQTISVVQILVLIAAVLMKCVAKALVVPMTRSAVTELVVTLAARNAAMI